MSSRADRVIHTPAAGIARYERAAPGSGAPCTRGSRRRSRTPRSALGTSRSRPTAPMRPSPRSSTGLRRRPPRRARRLPRPTPRARRSAHTRRRDRPAVGGRATFTTWPATSRGRASYAQVAAGLPPAAERADVLYLRALIRLEASQAHPSVRAGALRRRARRRAGAQIHGFQAISRWVDGDLGRGLPRRASGSSARSTRRTPRRSPSRSAASAYLEVCGLEVTPGLFERGMEIEAARPSRFPESPSFFHAVALFILGDLDRVASCSPDAASAIRSGEHARLWMHLQLVMMVLVGRPARPCR